MFVLLGFDTYDRTSLHTALNRLLSLLLSIILLLPLLVGLKRRASSVHRILLLRLLYVDLHTDLDPDSHILILNRSL